MRDTDPDAPAGSGHDGDLALKGCVSVHGIVPLVKGDWLADRFTWESDLIDLQIDSECGGVGAR
ncbi:uncharacterized protein RMCN_2081 [Mycolicibacterium novocastrense]|uniref:Uncharacterized protein n=1 Tax=Mycolicibacterium novocastrense TaxID=59813 RepID=A0ABQ0KIA3_MYCNV|nr:uncharacterized protein RMCN_2081 [Mycolicibacterium novocastrense]